jgi:hypothetical protein
MNHTTLSPRQRRAVQDFLDDCPAMGVTPTWACLPPAKLPGMVRQIRTVRAALACALAEPGHILVLTPDLRRLQLTHQEYDALQKAPTKNQ